MPSHWRPSARLGLLCSFVGTSAINYASTLLMGWLLAPGDFGLLAFVQTMLLICGMVLNAGVAPALAAALVREPAAERPALLAGALVLNTLLAAGLGAALLALFSLDLLRSGFERPELVVLVALTLPSLAWVGIIRATAQGMEHFGAMASVQLAESGVRALVGLGLVWAGSGVVGAAIGALTAGLLTSALGLRLLAGRLGIGRPQTLRWPAFRTVRDMFAAQIGFALLLNLDLVALKLLAGGDRAAAGQYQAATVVANLPYYLAAALLPLLFNQAARAGSPAEAGPPLRRALRLCLLIIVPVELALAAWPSTVIGLLFPQAYTQAAEALRLLALGNSAIVCAALVSTTLQAIGQARTAARVFGVVLPLEALALALVVPQGGGRSAAAIFAITAALAALVLLARYYALHTPRRLVFVGNYGNRNIGDDAILHILSERYAASHPAYRQHVFVRHHPDDVLRISAAEPVALRPASVWWTLRHTQLVVIGGGGLFGAHMGPVARYIPLFALLCSLLGKTVIYESVGIYSNTPRLQQVLLFLSMLMAQRVSVRDTTSWRMVRPLRRLGLVPVELVNDPALDVQPISEEAARRLLAAEGVRIPQDLSRLIVLSVKQLIRNPTETERLLGTLTATCEWLTEQGYTLLFVPFCADPAKPWEQDVVFAEQLATLLGPDAPVQCLYRHCTPSEAAGIIRLGRLMIGMRFHAMVFAHTLGVPLLPIAYEDKRTDFIRQHGYPSLPIAELSPKQLIDALAPLLGEARPEQQSAALAKAM
ncbi:MAG TPA: polysaccharide pyruvyl transferase family protein [Roseiflexaceae bacterium]|nr:polysaccharide pyruvyl transferase family protein [Roseiflexaceae bacterium]